MRRSPLSIEFEDGVPESVTQVNFTSFTFRAESERATSESQQADLNSPCGQYKIGPRTDFFESLGVPMHPYIWYIFIT